jgi:hypothetical protein
MKIVEYDLSREVTIPYTSIAHGKLRDYWKGGLPDNETIYLWEFENNKLRSIECRPNDMHCSIFGTKTKPKYTGRYCPKTKRLTVVKNKYNMSDIERLHCDIPSSVLKKLIATYGNEIEGVYIYN